jgi:hypothetical protein
LYRLLRSGGQYRRAKLVGHGHDLVVDCGKPGALEQLVLTVVGIEETDVVGDRSGQEVIVLHHGSDDRAKSARPWPRLRDR